MTLHVELLMPDRVLWSGESGLVIAKTMDGDLGVLTGHSPVLGILAEGSLVRIVDPEGAEGSEGSAGQEVVAAVSSGFLAVADDRVSILSRQAQLGFEVDTGAVQAELEVALEGVGPVAPEEEPTEVRYARARLRAAGERS